MPELISPPPTLALPAVARRGRRLVAVMSCVGLAAVGVLLVCLHAVWTQQATASRWVDHTLGVMSGVDDFERDLSVFVREARSIMLFNGWDRVADVDREALLVRADIARLRRLTADNPAQQTMLAQLEPPVTARISMLRDMIRRLHAGEAPERVMGALEQQRTLSLASQIANGSDALKAEERRLLAQRRAAASRAAMLVWAALAGFALIGAASLVFAMILHAARTRERRHFTELSALNAQLEQMTRHLVRARDAAERSNRAKTHFLAGMSHELRTPLNGILGYARLLRMEGGLSQTQTMRVDAMLGAGKHLLHMIARVLDLSEIEAERLELQTELIDLPVVVASCIELMRPAADQKGLTLTSSMAPGTPRELLTDSMRLQQILLNLLGNAVKFTAKGSVELRLLPRAAATGLRIEVADTGPGIPPDQRARLFQDFERLDTEATRAAEGAGLGLSLSAKLAAFMGGRIGCDDAPGGGSIFWLELPFAPLTAEPPSAVSLSAVPAAALPAPPSPPGKTGPLVLLVVDDILMNRDIAGAILSAAGHEVTAVESGAEAIEAVAAKDFDVVLMDVRMPEMDGLEATRRIRALEGPRGRVPILALTAQAFTDQIAQCRAAGMDGHLVKPFDADALLASVVRAAAPRDAVGTQAAALPPAPVIGADLPVFDDALFERTAAFLEPGKIAAYMQSIAAASEALALAISAPDALPREARALADQAHALSSSAGMLGFTRVATLGRRFEHAVQSSPAEIAPLAQGLAAALAATLEDIRRRTDAGQPRLPADPAPAEPLSRVFPANA
jgi:signal transduction histidine kinase/ActR/RegA family two-component response regulator/HPt (histidine-containing phosphotransfer) domain-containing protein